MDREPTNTLSALLIFLHLAEQTPEPVMKRILPLLLVLFTVIPARAQLSQFTIDASGNTGLRIEDLKTDRFGNLFISGHVFQGTGSVDLDPSDSGELMIQSNNLFLAKYSSNGELLYGKEFQRPAIGNNSGGPYIEVTDQGEVFISGNEMLTDFDPGSNAAYHPYIGSGNPCGYLAKYDHAGNLLYLRSWLPETGNSGSNMQIHQMTRFGDTIVITGTYTGAIDFNPTSGLDVQSGHGFFISRLNLNGNYIGTQVFQKIAGSGEIGYISDVVCTAFGSIIMFGVYVGSVDFDPSPVDFILNSPNCQSSGKSTFACKISSSGELIYAARFDENSGYCGANNSLRTEIRNDRIYAYVRHGDPNFSFDLDLGPGSQTEGLGNSILVMDTSFNYIEHRIVGGNGSTESTESSFCLTDNGFCIIGRTLNQPIDYTIGGGVDLLPTAESFVLVYDFDYYLVQAIAGIGSNGEHGQIVTYDAQSNDLIMSVPMNQSYMLTDEFGTEIETIDRPEKFVGLLRGGFKKNLVSGKIYVDTDNDGTISSLDTVKSNVVVSSIDNHGNTRFSISNAEGEYRFYLDTAQYTKTANPVFSNPYWYYTPSTYSTNLAAYTAYDTTNHFLMTYDSPATDVLVSVVNTIGVRINSDVGHRIVCANLGTQTETVSIDWTADQNYTFVSSNYPYSLNGNDVSWSQIEIEPLESVEIIAVFHNAAFTGNTVTNTIVAIPSGSDADNSNNTAILTNEVVGSYDPNDKQVFPREALTPQEVANGMWLDYLVRFQNTGNDTAFSVYIVDTLSSWLDVSSLQVLTASDDYVVNFLDSNVLEFRFDNILLPDSTIDEPNSHGHVAYRIKMNGGLTVGDTIYNSAAIYFDYNEPVITNSTKNYIQLITGITEQSDSELRVYPNPTTNICYLNDSGAVVVFDVTGREVMQTRSVTVPTEVDLSSLPKGVYTLRLTNENGTVSAKVVRK
jgi:hypothetical protein